MLDIESEEVKIAPPEIESYGPENVLLDEESILLEKPKLDEEEKKEGGELSQLEVLNLEIQNYVLGMVNYQIKGQAKDEISKEVIQAFLERILDKSLNWLVFSQALLERSRNEMNSTKRRDRSML